MNEYLKGVNEIANIFKHFIELQYPPFTVDIRLPFSSKPVENTTNLQIIVENRGSEDLSNVNIQQNSLLPAERIDKQVITRYAFNFVSYTVPSTGFNISLAVAPYLTSCLNTQRALYILQEKGVRVPYIGKVQDVSTAEGSAVMSRQLLEITILTACRIETEAEYYDDFTNEPSFIIEE